MNTLARHFKSFWMLFCVLMLGQCLSAQISHSATQPETTGKGLLNVRLLVPSPAVCVGQSTLGLEAVLTNSSEESVELSAEGVVHSVSFRKYVNGKQTNGTGSLLDFKPEQWITVAPHQSVVIPFTEPITDKLFGAAGFFSVAIEFGVVLKKREQYSRFPGSVPSNTVIFLLTDCKSDPPTITLPR